MTSLSRSPSLTTFSRPDSPFRRDKSYFNPLLFSTMRFAAPLLAICLAPASTLGSPLSPRDCTLACIEKETDRLLLEVPIADFIKARDAHDPLEVIWTSDGCSVPKGPLRWLVGNKDKPFGFKFLPSCYRHDFGYRNYKQQARLNKEAEEKLDKNFRE